MQPPEAPKATAADKLAPADKAASDDKPNEDKDAIQGAWRVTTVETDGKEQDDVGAKSFKAGQWVFTADKLAMSGPIKRAAYKLDPTKKLKALDIFPAYPPDEPNEGAIPAIYELEGDVLKICLGPTPSQIKPPGPGPWSAPQADSRSEISYAPVEMRRPKEMATKAGGYSPLLTLKREPADKDKATDDKPRDDAAAIQGVWRVTAVEREGKDQDDADARSIKKQKWEFMSNGLLFKTDLAGKLIDANLFWSYTIHPTRTPKTIDVELLHQDVKVKEPTLPGIY